MNKLTATRGDGGGGNQAKKGKGHQETCIKDPQAKPKRGRLRVGESGGGKMETTILKQQ